MVRDNAMDHSQPEPDAFSHAFGGKKRLKDPLQHLWGHAMTSIRDGQAERWPRLQGGMGHREIRGDLDRVETHREAPPCRSHGMFGITTEVHQHLVELRRIGQYGARRSADMLAEVDRAG